MHLEAHNQSTGEHFSAEAPSLSDDNIRDLLSFDLSDAAIRRNIDNLSISADGKSALYAVSKLTVRAGQTIVYIGKKILDLISAVLRDFPSATFGLVFGAIIGALITSIPIIGFLLGPFITPIVLAFGLTVGAYQDIRDKSLARRIAEVNASFTSLKTG